MLKYPPAIDDVLPLLAADDFYDHRNAAVYGAIALMFDQGLPVDLVSLCDFMGKKGSIENVGGYHYVASLLDGEPLGSNASYYAKSVKDHAIAREVYFASHELVSAVEQKMPGEEILELAEHKLFGIAEKGRTSEGAVRIDDVFHKFMTDYDAGRDGIPTYTSSGFAPMDSLTGGLHKGELMIVAARPSVGKTAFAINMMHKLVTETNASVLFCSMEMSKIEIVERLLSIHTEIDHHKIRSKRLSSDDEKAIVRSTGEMNLDIIITDAGSQTVTTIAAEARKCKRRYGLDAIIIDYLQLMTPTLPKGYKVSNREEAVSSMSRGLKILAKNLQVPVVCLCQLNRDVEKRVDGKPRLSDLRESGAIEQDADTVLMLHRLPSEEPSDPIDIIDVLVPKQRNGPQGSFKLRFRKACLRFEEIEFIPPSAA